MSHVWIVERRFYKGFADWTPAPPGYAFDKKDIGICHGTRAEARDAAQQLQGTSEFNLRAHVVEFRAAKYVRED